MTDQTSRYLQSRLLLQIRITCNDDELHDTAQTILDQVPHRRIPQDSLQHFLKGRSCVLLKDHKQLTTGHRRQQFRRTTGTLYPTTSTRLPQRKRQPWTESVSSWWWCCVSVYGPAGPAFRRIWAEMQLQWGPTEELVDNLDSADVVERQLKLRCQHCARCLYSNLKVNINKLCCY